MSSPGLGALGLDEAHRLAGGVLDQPAVAVLAVQAVLELLLDARQAVVVGAHGADQLPRQLALRIGAPRLDHGADALDPELRRPSRPRRRRACAAGRRSPCPCRRAVSSSSSRSTLHAAARAWSAVPRGVVDQERVGEDGDRVLGDGQLQAPAVGDRAAARAHLEVLHLLAHGALLELAGAHGAQPGGPAAGQSEEDQEEEEEEADPAVEEASHRPAATPPCRRRAGVTGSGATVSARRAPRRGSTGATGSIGRGLGRPPARPGPPARRAGPTPRPRRCAWRPGGRPRSGWR